jgi:hypothetical protein
MMDLTNLCARNEDSLPSNEVEDEDINTYDGDEDDLVDDRQVANDGEVDLDGDRYILDVDE